MKSLENSMYLAGYFFVVDFDTGTNFTYPELMYTGDPD
jgi:hypothetical protein